MSDKLSLFSLFLVSFVLIGLGGCVAKSDYLQKQAEADALGRDRAALTAKNIDLMSQVETLTATIKRLTADREGLTADKEGLVADKERLLADRKRLLADQGRIQREKADLLLLLNRTTEETGRTIAELRNRNFELSGDKQMLEESIALLRKTKEAEVRSVSTTYEELLAEMKDEIAQGQIAISELEGKLTVDVVDKILFESGQAEIRPAGLEVLKRVVEILITVTDKTIRVEGHTDSVPIAGALARRFPTNWELSAARAINVTRYLEKQGIDPALLAAVAFGEHQPVAGNDTPEGRAKNRRIAIILLPKE